ncbi:putative HTH-type transcriptional regulator [Janthinobacterium sp. HH104]|uniref:ArsR/SmtB family transcription factor n=1 Tax=Janthinobacterium sp. HH104 TaxID=1537276 RepID=UPI0008759141|nr:metalloregulator ArsR/SmtB family transcription factor [Janthinobacterium sp. HH104]OEZ83903.1 putative HTH-type transcriptional regulator [Janthinobacterium sp. HH104]
MKNADIEFLTGSAGFAHILGSAPRLRLLEQIVHGEYAVEQLVELTGLSVANTSQHLQQLRRAGFVQARRDGKRVLYRLGSGPIVQLLAALDVYAQHQRSELQALGRGDHVEAITGDELLERMREASITVLDVRPAQEFAVGHLPGAVNIPIDDLQRRLDELPANAEIAAYCRGPYCVLSVQAVAALRQYGLQARRLGSGYDDWQAAGLPVVKAA